MAGPGAGEPALEDERSFSDICGGRLALHRRYYSPSCLEFCLSCPRISLRSLTAVTCTVWLAAYGLFTLCEVRPASESGARVWKDLWGLRLQPRALAGPSCRRAAWRAETRWFRGRHSAAGQLSSFLNVEWTLRSCTLSPLRGRCSLPCGSTQHTSRPCSTAWNVNFHALCVVQAHGSSVPRVQRSRWMGCPHPSLPLVTGITVDSTFYRLRETVFASTVLTRRLRIFFRAV